MVNTETPKEFRVKIDNNQNFKMYFLIIPIFLREIRINDYPVNNCENSFF